MWLSWKNCGVWGCYFKSMHWDTLWLVELSCWHLGHAGHSSLLTQMEPQTLEMALRMNTKTLKDPSQVSPLVSIWELERLRTGGQSCSPKTLHLNSFLVRTETMPTSYFTIQFSQAPHYLRYPSFLRPFTTLNSDPYLKVFTSLNWFPGTGFFTHHSSPDS
jgi:hypothetical protein